jgi:hypothetical protein
MPVQVDVREVANGQEIITVYGKLEVRVPVRASSLDESSFLAVAVELPKARLKGVYPHVSEKLKEGEPEDSYERNARRSVYGGTGRHDDTKGQITFERWWIRPWVFEDCEKEKRDILKQLFPNGAYVAFAGDVYCESRNESLDDYWSVSYATPGDAQFRSAPGDTMLPIQEQFNTFCNIEIDTYEHAIPVTLASSRLIDSAKIKDRRMQPGEWWSVQDTPGQPVSAGVYETRTGAVSPQMVEFKRSAMGEVSQFCTGMFPALFGGGAVGTDTASGYAMQRDQALGRMGLPRRSIAATRARVAKQAVKCFAKHRPMLEPGGEVAYAVFGKSGAIESKVISLDRLKGQFSAYPEANDDFPATWTQRRNIAQTMLESQNQMVQQYISMPSNFESMTKELGIKEVFILPEADARNNQLREIEAMVKGGVPAPVDLDLDAHQVHVQTILEWWESEAGQAARLENPDAVEMIRLHLQQHNEILMMQQMQQAQAQAAAAGQPAEGQAAEQPAQDGADVQLPYA